jgi:hypothetical protein
MIKSSEEKTGWMNIMLLKYNKYLELPQVKTISLYYFDEAVLGRCSVSPSLWYSCI